VARTRSPQTQHALTQARTHAHAHWNRYKEDNLNVMFVGGPNTRTDFHLDLGSEFFFQMKGNMELPTVRSLRIPQAAHRSLTDAIGMVTSPLHHSRHAPVALASPWPWPWSPCCGKVFSLSRCCDHSHGHLT
jgi:hypothetical protein